MAKKKVMSDLTGALLLTVFMIVIELIFRHLWYDRTGRPEAALLPIAAIVILVGLMIQAFYLDRRIAFCALIMVICIGVWPPFTWFGVQY